MKKLVLAYSGGLDTSYCAKYLSVEKGFEVHAVSINTGGFSQEEINDIESKALKIGAKTYKNVQAVDRFYDKVVKYLIFGNVLKNNTYPLSVSAERIIQAVEIINYAKSIGAEYVAHGSTGAGNDQVRFELGGYALKPGVKVIAPWREWDLTSREKLMAYCEEHNIPVDFSNKKKKSPYSMDANLLHISYEGGILEDPWAEAEEDMWRWSVSPEAAPEQPTYVELTYEKGDIVAIDGEALKAHEVLEKLNKLGGDNGIGRLDIVENRYVGMKSRGCYETPGGTIMLRAHRAIESLTLDREEAHLKDQLMPKYAEVIYNGYWWSPERRMLQAAIDETQKNVSGVVRMKLYKGNATVVGRKSEQSLFDESIATFEDDAGAYNQKDAEGFIKLNALRLRIAAGKGRQQS